MKAGLLRHPYLGEVRTYSFNNRQMMQNKFPQDRNPDWFSKYQQYRSFEWKYCLFPQSVTDNEQYQLDSMKPKQTSIKKIIYSGYYVTSLRDEILTRSKNNAKFAENQILYVMYTVACAWKEWKDFCRKYTLQNTYNAISSEHILLNQEGDIKLIMPFSSPAQLPAVAYYAPENIPPYVESPSAWNKSIAFSLGLIGAELITMKIAHPFYQYKGQQLKFMFQEYYKWIKFSQKNVPQEIFNLVMLMTDQNSWIRLKMGEFQALLFPYHQAILDGKQQKLDKQLSKNSLLQYLRNKTQKNKN